MQLKMVVLPAPLGPMRPTISNSSTLSVTSRSACRPPKRIETPVASRIAMQLEPFAFEPAAQRRGQHADAVGLEDECEDGQQAGQALHEDVSVVGQPAGAEEVVGQLLQV